jgi:hypothetical protein
METVRHEQSAGGGPSGLPLLTCRSLGHRLQEHRHVGAHSRSRLDPSRGRGKADVSRAGIESPSGPHARSRANTVTFTLADAPLAIGSEQTLRTLAAREARRQRSQARLERGAGRRRSSGPPPLRDGALTTRRDAVVYRVRSSEAGADSSAFRSNSGARGTQPHGRSLESVRKMEAPPGFEPGMEVLQTVQGRRS